jgi:hypothetical protein
VRLQMILLVRQQANATLKTSHQPTERQERKQAMRTIKIDAGLRQELAALRRLAATRREHSLRSSLNGRSTGSHRVSRWDTTQPWIEGFVSPSSKDEGPSAG